MHWYHTSLLNTALPSCHRAPTTPYHIAANIILCIHKTACALSLLMWNSGAILSADHAAHTHSHTPHSPQLVQTCVCVYVCACLHSPGLNTQPMPMPHTLLSHSNYSSLSTPSGLCVSRGVGNMAPPAPQLPAGRVWGGGGCEQCGGGHGS